MNESKMEDPNKLGVAKLLGEKNLYIFEKDVDGNAMKRFREVQQKVKKILVEQMRSTRQTDSDPLMVIGLLNRGGNDSDATPCLGAFCSPKNCKRIRRLLNSSRVRKLCEPNRGLPRLEVQVIGCSPLMRLAYQEVDTGFKVFNGTTGITTDQPTFSGAPLSLSHNSEETSRPRKRKGVGKGKALSDRLGLRREQSYSDPYSKQWDPLFSTDRHFKEDESYVQQKRLIDVDEDDDFAIFFTDFEESVPSSVEEVLDFCQGACLRDLQLGVGVSGNQLGAWLDDRSRPTREDSRCVREYKNPLTATDLYQLLNTARFDDPNKPDVDRRLIYISNLNPYYILALTETATFHQVAVFKDAIWKHLALQTSIRARVTHRGYKHFRLEFNLPYFALRPSPSPSEGSVPAASIMKPPRRWIDLSFLKLRSLRSETEANFGIHEAHISFALSGSDHGRWTAFAFIDTAFDDKELEENLSSCEGVGFHQDPIASDPWIQANHPIWDPREYFLAIFELRIAQVAREWQYLVQKVEQSVKEYREKHSLTLSQYSGPTATQEEDVKETEEWTRQIVEFLNLLQDGLSETIKAWEIFNSPKGDVGYFSDIDFSQKRYYGSLGMIQETFEALESHQRTLQKLSKSCRDSAQNLQLRLSRRGTEATISGTATSDFTLFVLGPPALAAACFQLPQTVLPFPHSPSSFMVLTIAIMVVMKLLQAISCVLPGFSWWWNKIVALAKMMTLEGRGNAIPLRSWSVPVQPGDHDRPTAGTLDVEMGIRT